MAVKEKHKKMYMEIAESLAKFSPATRLKVGSVIVKNNNIISTGYNALPQHIDGDCEYKEYMDVNAGGWLAPEEIMEIWPFEDLEGSRYKLITKPEVRHSEKNALMGLIKSNENAVDGILFCTHACCKFCAIDIVDSGISKVYYKNDYANEEGIEYLKNNGVEIIKWNN